MIFATEILMFQLITASAPAAYTPLGEITMAFELPHDPLCTELQRPVRKRSPASMVGITGLHFQGVWSFDQESQHVGE